MSEIKHTPLPWHYIPEWDGLYDSPDIRGAQVRIGTLARTPVYKANAEFILQACNSYYATNQLLDSVNETNRVLVVRCYELVEALEAIHEISQDPLNPHWQLIQNIAATARQALNKATAGIDRTSTTNLTEK